MKRLVITFGLIAVIAGAIANGWLVQMVARHFRLF